MRHWLDDFIAFKMTVDTDEERNAETEEAIELLRDELSALEDELSDIECNEPDDFGSPSYDRWEARRDLLEEHIMDVENEIADLENDFDF